MRRRIAVTLGAALALTPLSAKAGHCDAALGPGNINTSNNEPADIRFLAGVNLEAASFRTKAYEGHFVGVTPGLTAIAQNISLSLALPYYWLTRNGLASNGFGDLLGRLDYQRSPFERLELGVFGALSPPTGNAEQQLGMGHWMASAGLGASWTPGRFGFHAQLGYGRALVPLQADEHAAHVAGQRPLVDPMNLSELTGRTDASVRVVQDLRLEGGFYGALPVGVPGSSRAALSLSFAWVGTRFWASLGGHVPVYGNPFSWKATSSLGLFF